MVNNTAATKINDKNGLIFSVVLLLLVIICLAINYSIDQSINWSLYPAGALIVLWATVTPMLIMKKNKVIALFSGFAITLIPYLFLIQCLVPAKGWFIPLALPIAMLFLAALAISLLLFNNTRINKLYSAAVTVFLFGVAVNFAVEKIISGFLNGTNGDDIPVVLTISLSAIVSLILVVIGYTKKSKTTTKREG